MNHFVHCCSFSTSNKITSKGCQSASQTCDFDAKNAKFFWGGAHPLPRLLPRWVGGHPLPIHYPLGASILTPPILKFCLRYCQDSGKKMATISVHSLKTGSDEPTGDNFCCSVGRGRASMNLLKYYLYDRAILAVQQGLMKLNQGSHSNNRIKNEYFSVLEIPKNQDLF